MSEWLISSAVLTAVVICLRGVLKGKISLRLQYALWALVLLRLLLPVSFGESEISVSNFAQQAGGTEAFKNMYSLTEITLPHATYEDAYSQVSKEYSDRGIDIETMAEDDFQAVEGEIQSRVGREVSVGDIIIGLWLTGIGIVAAALIISNLRFWLMLRKSRRKLTMDIPTYYGRKSNLPIYISEAVDTPCLFGLIHPAIYITTDTAENPTVLHHALEHELTHFLHRDHIWAVLRGICLAVHWYNPLVWWAAVLSGKDAELACDEATIKRIGEENRADYGRTLIGMTRPKLPALLVTATTMNGTKKGIKERIMLIAKKPKTAAYTLVALVLITALTVGCTFTGGKTGENKETDLPEISVSLGEGDTIPQPVVDYALEMTKADLEYFVKERGDEIKEAQLTKITKIKTDAVLPHQEICVYRVDYRFLPANPDELKLPGGMFLEDGYITAAGSGSGNRYIILFKDEVDPVEDENLWEPLGNTNEVTMTEEYMAPGMADEYGDMYTAAAMATYVKYTREQELTPVMAIKRIYASGEFTIGVDLADVKTYNSYKDSSWYGGRMVSIATFYNWEEIKEPLPDKYNMRFILKNNDKASPEEVNIISFNDMEVMEFVSGDKRTAWKVVPKEGSEASLIRDIRQEFDNRDVDSSRIAFAYDGDAKGAADKFVHQVYVQHWMGLVPGSVYGIKDYKVSDWGVMKVGKKGNTVLGYFSPAFRPADDNENSEYLWAGNTQKGTGKYKGMLVCYRQFVLEKQKDGLWHCIGLGTGGYMLPEDEGKL